ncbi:alpha-amylase family protein [Jatrophihabitans fulvus]
MHPDVDGALQETSADRRELFGVRTERWSPDLRAALHAVYPHDAGLEDRVLAAAARAYADRSPALHRRDQERTLRPDWFQRPDMLGYAAYADRFGGDLAGVRAQIPYLSELGVTYLHLMPLLLPHDHPHGDSDGGYAVSDYRTVRPDLGTVDDLAALAGDLHDHGVSLVLDLVLNHVADDHEWVRRARAGEQRYRDYFHVFADRTGPDAYERTLPEVFPDFAPGNFTWDDELAAWVWTTFNAFQWDLNWANAAVFEEFVDLVLFFANLGVDVLRLDAIAFLWKRLGTNCQNQPEVHAITQALKAVLRIACPSVLLKAEAIVAPDDLVHYLGTGRHHGKVSDLAYHNVLMVQIWSMLATRDVRLTTHTLRSLPPAPSTTAWICYLRCHDDIGWAIGDADAAAVGLNGFAHRSFLSDFYTGAYQPSFARGLVFQANPATGDRRVSGMTASLAGLEKALSDGDADGVDVAVARVLLAYAIVLGWGGVPVLWMGDELAQPNDDHWADEPDHAADNRWAHRPVLDGVAQERRSDLTTPAGRVFAGLQRLVRLRASLPGLHAATASEVLEPSDPAVLTVRRDHPEQLMLLLFNVSESPRTWPFHRIAEAGLGGALDRMTGRVPEPDVDGDVRLGPYQAMWLVLDR